MYIRFEITDNGTVVKEFMPKKWRSFKRHIKIDYNYVNGNLDRTFKGHRFVLQMGWEQITSGEKTDLDYVIDSIRAKLPVKLKVIYRKVDQNLDPIPVVEIPADCLMTFNSDEMTDSEGNIVEMLPMEVEFESKEIYTP